jgi:hypothetical protein
MEREELQEDRTHMSGWAGRYVWTMRLFGGAEHGQHSPSGKWAKSGYTVYEVKMAGSNNQ